MINHKNILKKKVEKILAIINNIYFLWVKKNPILIKTSFFAANIIKENIKVKKSTIAPLISIKKYIDIYPYKKIFFTNAYSLQ